MRHKIITALQILGLTVVLSLVIALAAGPGRDCAQRMKREKQEHHTRKVKFTHGDAARQSGCPYPEVKTAHRDYPVWIINACGKFYTYRCADETCSQVPNGYHEPQVDDTGLLGL